MKTRVLYLFAALIIFASCTNEEVTTVIPVSDEFYCSIENEEPTRTSLDQNNNVIWSAEDQLVIFKKSSIPSKYQISESHVGKTSGSFYKVNSDEFNAGSELDHNVALYPYQENVEITKLDSNSPTSSYKITGYNFPAEQTYVENSFANGAFPMAAVSDNYDLTFRNICGGIKLQLKGTQRINSIKIEGKNSESIAGLSNIIVYSNEDTKPIFEISSNPQTSVTLNCKQGVQLSKNNIINFIIALPPILFSKGFIVTITDHDNKQYILETDKENSILRSSVLVMPIVELNNSSELPDSDVVEPSEIIVFEDTVAKNACVVKFDVNGDGELSYKEAAAVKDISDLFVNYTSITSFDELAYFTSVTSLPDRLFEGCQNLRSVKLHSNISSCGQYCFAGCISLTEIKLPQNLNSIGIGCFSGCSNLTSIIIPAGVCELSDHSFSACSSLSSIIISEGLQSIGNYSLSGCVNLVDLYLPDTITSLGDYSFNSCTSLESIELPTSVLELGTGCFANCTSLNKLALPATIVNIPAFFIKGCIKLNDFVIPNSVKSISADAFSGAYIEHLTIPESVTSLNGAFLDRNKIVKQVTCNASIRSIPTFYDSSRGLTIGCFAACTNLETVIINSQITSLPSYCFKECLYLKSVVLPNTVTSIGSGCFVNCFDLETLNIPNAVQNIGGGCFFNCKSLKSINIPSGVTNLPYSVLYYYGYDENRNRQNSYLGGGGCFMNCESLESVKIPSTITEMGRSSFKGCTSLQSVYIPSSVSILGDDFFYGCTALQSVNIPSSVSELGEDCFARCSSLQSINIPSSIHTIGEGCFIGCESLETVSIPSTVRQLSDNLFSSCLSLKTINIPHSVVEIGKGCFAFCKSLEEIAIPESVLQMGSACFVGCTSLSNIKLPSQIKVLPYGSCSWIGENGGIFSGGGYGFFENCSSLKNIVIPEGVMSLESSIFKGCSNLLKIELPSTLNNISSYAFSNTASSIEIYCKAAMPPTLTKDSFKNLSLQCSILVPSSSFDAYVEAPYWSSYKTNMRGYSF